MVAYNFQKQFVDAIRSGRKSYTIRKNGKRRHARASEMLQLYTGMRTANCKKIIPDPVCMASLPICIRIVEANITGINIGRMVTITDAGALEAFAINDGFASLKAMGEFWQKFHGQPLFVGTLVGWEPEKDKA